MSTYLSKLIPRPGKTKRGKRVSTPTVLQMEAVECGAASLSMVLSHHKCFVPLEELRLSCGVSRDGSKASNILRAARSYGFDASGYSREVHELANVKYPCIIFWNFNHFVVLEGYSGNRYYINDPAVGPRKVTAKEFDEAFTGVVLCFRRTPQVRITSHPRGIAGSLLRPFRNHLGLVTLIVSVTACLAIPALVAPVLSRLYIDVFLIDQQRGWLIGVCAGLILCGLVECGLLAIQQFALIRLEAQIGIASASAFLWHLLQLPTPFFSQRNTGDLTSRVQLNERIANLIAKDITAGYVNTLFIGCYALLMFHYDAVLTIVGLVVMVANFAFLKIMGRFRKDSNLKAAQERSKVVSVSISALQMIETMKATGGEADIFSRWAGYQAKQYNAEQQVAIAAHLQTTLPLLLSALSTALIVAIGARQVIAGVITIGTLTAFQALMSSFLAPIERVVALGGSIQEAHADIARIDDVLRYRKADSLISRVGLKSEKSSTKPSKLTGSIKIEQVTFGYSPLDKPLLRDLSLEILSGQRVALVGASGSGKSTLAKIIAGVCTPWSGKVLFDGMERGEIPREVMSSSLGFVDQEPALFEGTVRDNIAFWDEGLREEKLMSAVKDAYLLEDITVRPDGLDSIVEEEGRNFSGGQSQRMEIARALALWPSILILDEATSALDAESEHHIENKLRERACTCIIVAHRLSAVKTCDLILVFNQGCIVERGNHDELLSLKGEYAALVGEDSGE